MKCNIEPSNDRSYIVLTVEGEITGRRFMKHIIKAHALGKNMGINRYLLDVTKARNTESAFDSYEFAYSDMTKTEGIDVRARVAALVSPGDHSHDFIETVLSNAGLFLKIFTDPVMAREYLKKRTQR
jgi:hypothetical protein